MPNTDTKLTDKVLDIYEEKLVGNLVLSDTVYKIMKDETLLTSEDVTSIESASTNGQKVRKLVNIVKTGGGEEKFELFTRVLRATVHRWLADILCCELSHQQKVRDRCKSSVSVDPSVESTNPTPKESPYIFFSPQGPTKLTHLAVKSGAFNCDGNSVESSDQPLFTQTKHDARASSEKICPQSAVKNEEFSSRGIKSKSPLVHYPRYQTTNANNVGFENTRWCKISAKLQALTNYYADQRRDTSTILENLKREEQLIRDLMEKNRLEQETYRSTEDSLNDITKRLELIAYKNASIKHEPCPHDQTEKIES